MTKISLQKCFDEFSEMVRATNGQLTPEVRDQALMFVESVYLNPAISNMLRMLAEAAGERAGMLPAYVAVLEIGFELGQRYAAQEAETNQLETLFNSSAS